MNKAFFLDRDGTINIDTGYVMNPDDVKLLDGVGEAIRLMNQEKYFVIVISNQSGVARGYGSEQDVHNVNDKIRQLLKPYDAEINDFFLCPHHSLGKIKEYSIECHCRKPKTGMFEEAIRKYNLDPSKCIAVGDKLRDIQNVGQLGINKVGIVNSSVEGENISLLEFTKRILNISE